MRISDWSSDVCSSDLGKQGSLRDARGKLLFSMVEYARKLKPRAILIENVKALQSAPNLAGKRGGVVQVLKQELESLGDKVSTDRKSVVIGKRVSVRVDLGGRRLIKKKKELQLAK